jgi:hypothetical protein
MSPFNTVKAMKSNLNVKDVEKLEKHANGEGTSNSSMAFA